MAINGVGQYGGLYQTYKMPVIKAAETSAALSPKELAKQEELNRGNEYTSQKKEQENQASKMADLENISLTFNKEEDFGYLGKDSDILNLDVQKAVSDMQKDAVLQEYQYFVGSTVIDSTMQDGMVIQKGIVE